MATPGERIEAIIGLFTCGQLGEEEAIDQIVAVYPPGKITRRGAQVYLDRGTSHPGGNPMIQLRPGPSDAEPPGS